MSQHKLRSIKLQYRWAAQIVGLLVTGILAVIGMHAIWDGAHSRGVHFVFFVVLMALSFTYYRYKVKDLLMLTAWILAMMLFVLSLLAHSVFDNFDAGGLLLMAISLIAMSTWAVKWIKQTHALFQSEQTS
jgi:hypothetical protein